MSSELPRFAAPETLAIAPAEATAAAPVAVDWLAIAALATVVVLFVGLFVLRRRRLVRFGGRTLIALAAGIGVGLGFRGHLDLVAPIGDLYVQLVIAIVAPLIVVSILSSVTSLGGTASVRTIGVRSAAWLLGLNLIAILLTLGIALSVGLGKGAAIEIDGVDGSTLSGLLRPLDQVLLGSSPRTSPPTSPRTTSSGSCSSPCSWPSRTCSSPAARPRRCGRSRTSSTRRSS